MRGSNQQLDGEEENFNESVSVSIFINSQDEGLDGGVRDLVSIEHKEATDFGRMDDTPQQVVDNNSRGGEKASPLLVECAPILADNFTNYGLPGKEEVRERSFSSRQSRETFGKSICWTPLA